MPIEFLIPQQLSIDGLQSQLREYISLQNEPLKTLNRTAYDTFDWRVHAHGSVLEQEADGKGATLIWRALDNHHRHEQIPLNQAPHFVWDLPPGRFRDQLQPILEMRELIPLVSTHSRIHTFRVLNSQEKTVLRLAIEENTLQAPKGKKAHKLDNRILVLPVKGYRKPVERVKKILQGLGLNPATDDIILKALSVAGHSPGSYSSKLNLHLDPAMRADEATKQILRRLLDMMMTNEAGTRNGSDTEFLHDFRVAIRRTRSALAQIKGVFPQRTINRFKDVFAWLGQLTSPTRDLDVYLLTYDDYRNSLPSSAQNDLEPLRGFLLKHQKIEHGKLVAGLDSARYRKALKDWRAFLETRVPQRSTLANAKRPVHEVAGERIWRVYRRVLKEGQAIHPDTPAEALHELRKTCKKLRYLMEFFQSLYPAGDIKSLIRVLKALQDNLGNFQDFEVQVMTLKQFSHQMMEEGAVAPETLMAMGMLVENLERRQQQARKEFAERFGGFAEAENRKHFRGLFAPPAPKTEKSQL